MSDFNADFSPHASPSLQPMANGPIGAQFELSAGRQVSHAQGGRKPFDGSDTFAQTGYLEEFIQPGFRSLDAAMLLYWSGIRVPTKDSYRLMRVKIAGGDKSLMVWADDLREQRVRLPVAALDRTGFNYNKEKYSPPFHAMTYRYLGSRGDLAARVFRPVPVLVDYTFTIWAESKRDIEYVLQQVTVRFHQLAEFRMFDGKLEGNVVLKLVGATDASEKEAGFEQRAKRRYEFAFSADAWLPLPEQIVPTVLGRIQMMKESSGSILDSIRY